VIFSGGSNRFGDGDDLYGGPGDDRLKGAPTGLEGFWPGGGRDYVDGRSGFGDDDYVNYTNARRGVRVDLPHHTATGQGRDAIFGIEHVTGSAHADIIIGNYAGNFLYGEGGADRIFGRRGDDMVDGGPGPDRIFSGRSGQRDCCQASHGGLGNDRIFGGRDRDFVNGDWATTSCMEGPQTTSSRVATGTTTSTATPEEETTLTAATEPTNASAANDETASELSRRLLGER
jgi:Ca2+-binding RTX toxin-like protein